jgi:arylsulfatase A-like enzyme
MKTNTPSRRDLLAGLILPLWMPRRASAATRPNIVVILLDDARWDDIHCGGQPFVDTPNIDRIAREGAEFQNAFVTTPLCSPSRASFLTGLYSHTHGVTDNTDHSALSHKLDTFPRHLQSAGYETAFIGKWHMGVDDSPRPGFDYWAGFKGQGTYFDPEFNVNGKRQKFKGYTTDLLSDRAVEFLGRQRNRPFLLYLPHKAVHPELTQNADGSVNDLNGGRFVPAERHKNLYAAQPVPHRPSVGRAPEGKPALLRPVKDMPALGPETGTTDETVRNRLRMMVAVDEGIGRMWDVLRRSGELDNTIFVFTSDEGYFYGEHGLSIERRLAYEESIKIPLLIRYPKLVKAGSRPAEMTLNIDLAPTLLELAGVPVPPGVQGRSLAPVLGGHARNWRKSFLIEHYSDAVFPRVEHLGYRAVRTTRWKYIRYTELSGMDELYDQERDPYEMHNLVNSPSASDALADARKELARLLRETGL